ncbi:MAG: polysaccharide deacetylase family protein [Micropruina sp.]|nr:polysaccharide deacetylase family protein [Micropruina sp.]
MPAIEPGGRVRVSVKRALARLPEVSGSRGATLLIYHRVGGGTLDELDLGSADFVRQLDLLAAHDVVSLDEALNRLDAGDERPTIVLTFDDGFSDVFQNAWPHLLERGLPFIIYLASGYVGRTMVWEGSTARGTAGSGLSWDQLAELLASGLATIGNHTHTHLRPEVLGVGDVDDCSDAIEQALGVRPAHFTYPWGVPVPGIEAELRSRFRSASTGDLGRNLADADRWRLRRVPVRRTDPLAFFEAKLTGNLRAEHAYARLVSTAKVARRVMPKVGRAR